MADPVPKPASQTARPNRAAGKRKLPAKSAIKAPPLRGQHHPRTRDWWKRIWKSPMAAAWIDADILTLEVMADLLDEIYEGRTGSEFLSEFRHLSDRMGLTPLSRRRLSWEIDQAQQAQAAPTKAQQKAQDDRWLRVVSS